MKVKLVIQFALFLLLYISTSTISKHAVIHKLASQKISLEKRYGNSFVNSVFKDNILLNMAYMRGMVKKASNIDWNIVREPFVYKFSLLPGNTFAFHDDVLDKYKDSLKITSGAHFNYEEGFKFSGILVGDGVCHLASLIYWVAKDANLNAFAPTNHNFASIPEIDRTYGVSIYSMPGAIYTNAMQNLYITNHKYNTVEFEFIYAEGNLELSIYEIEETKNMLDKRHI